MFNDIYTIGYSSFSIEEFLKTLIKNKITATADVRSQPYSQFKSEFNRENLKNILMKNQIAYVFLGNQCGARIDAPEYYLNGKVNFNLVKHNKEFREGLTRLRNGMENYRVAIMCAEKDPLNCHRTILICRNLRSGPITIKHILENGLIEDHLGAEKRLIRIHKLDKSDMFCSEAERLEEAYNRQGDKIAFSNSGETQRKVIGEKMNA